MSSGLPPFRYGVGKPARPIPIVPRSPTLVVYYSRSGVTKDLALALATKHECDLEEIVDVEERNGFRGYWRSVAEARQLAPSAIIPSQRDPATYDLVVIGTPVWCWSVSPPVRAYLLSNRFSLPDVAFFCTMTIGGAAATFREMQRLCGKVPRAVVAATKRDAVRRGFADRLEQFLDAAKSSQWGTVRPWTSPAVRSGG